MNTQRPNTQRPNTQRPNTQRPNTQRPNTQRPRPRLYLTTPALDDTAAFVGGLDAALGGGDVAAVLLRLNDADERSLINRAKAVAAMVHKRDIALLLDGRAGLAAHAGADGAHLTGIAALHAALPALHPDRIAGAGGLHSRHDAMLAGEAGADYAMFGEPRWGATPHGRQANEDGGSRPAFAAVLDRVAWWAELFQPPCIGYAAMADEILPLAKAGADFVALGEWIWNGPGGVEAAVALASQNLAQAAP